MIVHKFLIGFKFIKFSFYCIQNISASETCNGFSLNSKIICISWIWMSVPNRQKAREKAPLIPILSMRNWLEEITIISNYLRYLSVHGKLHTEIYTCKLPPLLLVGLRAMARCSANQKGKLFQHLAS